VNRKLSGAYAHTPVGSADVSDLQEFDGGSGFDLDLAVSSLSADRGDSHLMLRLLTERLAPVLGDRLRLERSGGLRRKNQELRRVEVQIGDDELLADLGGASPTFQIGHLSGGIRIRTERVDIDEWLRRLLSALQSEAAHSEKTRLALEAIVIEGGT
jgi:hypothetical protein